MGSIKNKANEPDKAHELTEAEFNYVMNINQAKQNHAQEYNRVMSAFLKYLAVDRFGYASDDDLQFELDFEDKKRILKVTKLPKE